MVAYGKKYDGTWISRKYRAIFPIVRMQCKTRAIAKCFGVRVKQFDCCLSEKWCLVVLPLIGCVCGWKSWSPAAFHHLPAVVAYSVSRNMAEWISTRQITPWKCMHAKVCLKHLWIVALREAHRSLWQSAFASPGKTKTSRANRTMKHRGSESKQV